MRTLVTVVGAFSVIVLLGGCAGADRTDAFDAKTLSDWRSESEADHIAHGPAQVLVDATKANAPGFISKFEVTVTTSNVKNASTNAHVWLIVSVHASDAGQTDSTTAFLGTGAGQGSTKTFEVSSVRGDFNQERAGGLTLVNGMNGDNADWSIDRVRVVGTDHRGKRWLIADYTIPSAQAYRRWLRNDPSINRQGPALPIPTMGNWQALN